MVAKIIRFALIFIAVAVVVFLGFRTFTKSSSPAAEAVFEDNGLKITVSYSRPYKKNRDIFGTLVPFGQVWRTGANEATEITFSKDVVFGGKPVAAGTYALFTIPEKDKWTIILNSVLGQWGHFTYDATKDVIRTQVTPVAADAVAEQFLIQFIKSGNGANLEMLWDKTKVAVPVEGK